MTSLYSYFFSCIGSLCILSLGVLASNHQFPLLETRTIEPHFELTLFHQDIDTSAPFSTPPQEISIDDLLQHSQDYHQHMVSVRGLVTQPELHMDESELFLDFVFRLSHGQHSLVVYGRHDRTLGAPVISMNRVVQVVGIFWKDRTRKGETIFNALEAVSVTPYPSTVPKHT
jgi:hypothetical protein